MGKKILVWLSGWVDSAVSALLLKQAWYEVSCGFMINYLDDEHPWNCPTRIDLDEARKVAEFLELPFYTFDYREEYEKRIIAYIYEEYEAGRTPNPDVFCNNLVKFDLFLEEAISLWFDGIATGHYARIVDGRLLKGVDAKKDQSYFLSRLSPFQLSKAIFPIGHLEKSQVRAIAEEAHLPNAKRKDSQWLCFIGKVSMKEFLEKRLPKKSWDILSIDGKIIWKHEGAFSYTIGQRRGIKVWWWAALFIIDKSIKDNTITVWWESDLNLFSSSCALLDWVGEPPSSDRIFTGKVRYRQEDQEVTLQSNWWKIFVNFKIPQRAIAPGQICVVYDRQRVFWSGVIE